MANKGVVRTRDSAVANASAAGSATTSAQALKEALDLMSIHEYDHLISSIYGAVTGANDWRRLCGEFARLFGLWQFQITGLRKRDNVSNLFWEAGTMPPESRIDYLTHFHQANPRIAPAMALEGREWFHAHETLGEHFIETNAYFQDYMVSYGARWFAATKLVETDEMTIWLSTVRDCNSRPLNRDEIATLDVFRTHLSNGLQLELELHGTANRSADYQAMLAALPHAVAVVTADRRVEHGNSAWQKLIAADGPLVVRDGLLACTNEHSEAHLETAFARLLPEAGRPAVPNPSPSNAPADRLVWRSGKAGAADEHLMIAVALRPRRTAGVFGNADKMLLIAHPLRSAPVLDSFLISHALELTPAEAQVATALARGQKPEDVARQRNVSPQTVRTQLRTVYQKLDVSRQSDLVRMLSELPRLDEGAIASAW